MRRAAAIAWAWSVVLGGGAGCGASRALPLPSGAVGGSDGGAAAVAVVSLDANTSDATALEASGALDALTAAADARPSLPPNRYRALAISVGRLHSCAILDDHRVKAIATGMYTTCATLDDDTLKCWGAYPPRVANGLFENIGIAPGEMGDNLTPIDLGAGRKPVAVAIGMETLGVFDDGTVREVSFNSPGGPTPVDFGGRSAAYVAAAAGNGGVKCAILRAGGTACTGDHNDAAVPVDAAVTALAMTESSHACGLEASGAVTC